MRHIVQERNLSLGVKKGAALIVKAGPASMPHWVQRIDLEVWVFSCFCSAVID